MQTDQRLLNAIVLSRIVAWRIHTITMTSRAYPDVSCEVVFEPQEWHTIDTMQHHRHPPQAPPSLREVVRGLAQLGGFLARTGDGEPDMQAIWQGYQRLHEFIYALETHRSVNALEKCIKVSARHEPRAPARRLHTLVRQVWYCATWRSNSMD